MFILIKADHGILSGDNDVSTYGLHRDAWLAMCRQVDDVRQQYDGDDWDGVSSEEQHDSYEKEQPYWGVEYQVDHDHAFVEPCDGPEWHIFEV